MNYNIIIMAKLYLPDLEIELVIWITDHRMQGYAISTAELRLKATHLARHYG
jgi:hypothetical protein